MLKRYRLGFEIWGLLLFLIIMIPNFIWFAVHAPSDILRAASSTKRFDTIASVCQIGMIASLCIFRNKESKRLCKTPFAMISAGCCLLYFVSWFLYYGGIVNAFVIFGLTVFPCFSFLLFAIDRKNGIAFILTLAFTICHFIYVIVNFII